jgi:multidrug efflux pump subunit AcrB
VAILQLGLSGEGLSEQQLNDFAMNNIRTLLATVAGASVPWPYGGRVRQITIDIDQNKLNGLGLSPNDVLNAVNAQNIVLPTGTLKIGPTEYNVGTNEHRATGRATRVSSVGV